MVKKLRRAFTIVELVIVIAVIAILAAVLIPTFTSLIQKANQSNDTTNVKNMNTILTAAEATDGKAETMYDAVQVIKEGGYDLSKLTPTGEGYDIVWDQEYNRLALVNDGEVVFSDSQVSTEKWKLWIVTDEQIETEYSVYLIDGFAGDSYTAASGVDVGENEGINVTIATEGTKNDLKVRTNGGTLTVNAPNATVSHYEAVDTVNITAVAGNSYHEYGTVDFANIQKGNFVVEAQGTAGTVTIPATATGAVSVNNKGSINLLNTVDATVSVSITNSGTLSTAVVGEGQQITGTPAENTYDEIVKLTADTHEITAGGYYDGTGVTITAVNDSTRALYVKTNEPVIINGVTLKGKNGLELGDSGNALTKGDYHVVLTNCVIQVQNRAIQLWYGDIDDNKGSTIEIYNCNIENTQVTDYDTETSSGTQGLMLNNIAETTVKMDRTEVLGFGYAILTNYHKDLSYSRNEDSVFEITNTVFKGRSVFDLLSSYNNTIYLENSLIRGINIFKGPSEEFADIVVESGDNNVFHIKDNVFESYRSPVTPNNNQFAFDIRTVGTTINFYGSNTMTGYFMYANDATDFPTDSSDFCYLVDIQPDTVINGGFTEAKAICTQGSNEIVLDWNKMPSVEAKDYFYYYAVDGSFKQYHLISYFSEAAASWFMNGEAITLQGDGIVIENSITLAALHKGETFLMNFNGYSIEQKNGAQLIIPEGVVIKTDSTTSVKQLFAAANGCELVETKGANNCFEYTAVAQA